MKYRKGYKYQLADTVTFKTSIKPFTDTITEFIILYTDGTLTIKSGYAWDGPSGPTVDTKASMQGALLHDALYQLIRCGYLSQSCREQADFEFKQQLLKDGMWKWRANLWYIFVKKGAAWAALPRNKKKVYVVP